MSPEEVKVVSSLIDIGALGAKVDGLQTTMTLVHGRVFNGMAKEIMEKVEEKVKEGIDGIEKRVGHDIGEIKKQMSTLQKILFGFLVTLLASVILMFFTLRSDSDKNYKAIVDIGAQLSNHIEKTVPKVTTK